MKRTFLTSALIASLLAACSCLTPAKLPAAPIEIAEVAHEGPVDFEKEILPLFRRNCLA